jgi:hypothetical protein
MKRIPCAVWTEFDMAFRNILCLKRQRGWKLNFLQSGCLQHASWPLVALFFYVTVLLSSTFLWYVYRRVGHCVRKVFFSKQSAFVCNVAEKFLKNLSCQQCRAKEQYTEQWNISNHSFSAGQKYVFLLNDAGFTLNRMINSKNNRWWCYEKSLYCCKVSFT